MSILHVKLQNCYGIAKMEHDFVFTEPNSTIVVYAPNGVMKSSFAKTMLDKADPTGMAKPKDEFFTDRVSISDITWDAGDMPSIIVADATKEIDSSSQVSKWLASKELKDRYDAIYKELDDAKKPLLIHLRDVAKSTDCEEEIINTFGSAEGKSNFFSCIESQYSNLGEGLSPYDFRFNDMFDKDAKSGKIHDFVDKNKTLLQNYFNDYSHLLQDSVLFNNSEYANFGTYQAKQLQGAVSDDAFFLAHHKIELSNGIKLENKKAFDELYENELDKILKDEKLKKSFEKIDVALGKNAELRSFKMILEKHPDLAMKLMDIDSFRKEVLLSYLSQYKEECEKLIALYQKKTNEIKQLIDEAGSQRKRWEKVLDIFRGRFFVPFQVDIENEEEVILKESVAHLKFEFKDEITNETSLKEKKILEKLLSVGERRALYILQLLFEIEGAKALGKESLIIYDDIADSFDYKNKFAIIEYLNDLKGSELFYQIILTHNFDFYRTLGSRLNLSHNLFMAYKTSEGAVEIKESGFTKDYMHKQLFEHLDNNKCSFVGTLPVARNLIEYSFGQHEEYNLLTACLHIKDNTKDITANDILSEYQKVIYASHNITLTFGHEKILNLINEVAESIIFKVSPDELDLKDKLALSIAIRLKAEEYMIAKINDSVFVSEIKKDQTKKLFDKYRTKYPEDGAIPILERVNMMTPMNIHFNAFMYEPLVDMSILHLIQLYKDVKALNEQ